MEQMYKGYRILGVPGDYMVQKYVDTYCTRGWRTVYSAKNIGDCFDYINRAVWPY